MIQRDVEDAISEKILMGELEDGQRVKVDAEGEGILASSPLPVRRSKSQIRSLLKVKSQLKPRHLPNRRNRRNLRNPQNLLNKQSVRK